MTARPFRGLIFVFLDSQKLLGACSGVLLNVDLPIFSETVHDLQELIRRKQVQALS
jgi:hypothetical protein